MARILTGGSGEHLESDEPLDEYIYRHLRENGDIIDLTNATKRQQWTSAQVLNNAHTLAQSLAVKGLGRGDTITFYASNSEDFVFLVLACIQCRVVVSTVNPAATPYELKHYLKELQPTLIFTESRLLANLKAALSVVEGKPHIITKDRTPGCECIADLYRRPDTSPAPRRPVDIQNDVCCIVFSSGTSGLPKGVMLTHHNITTCLGQLKVYMAEPNIKSILCPFPMYHSAGLIAGIFGFTVLKINFIFMEKFDFQLLLESIQRYRPEGVGLPPPVVVAMTKSPLVDQYDLSSMRYCGTGAAPVTKEMEEAFKSRFNNLKMQQTYGMSEVVCSAIWRDYHVKSTEGQGSSGKAGVGMEIKITNPDTREMLGPNARGEILIRSKAVMKGYLNNPEATRNTIDKDGWLHSGDIGYYDDDEYIYIVDRLKELIKYKGNQVAPAELEALLLKNPEVADVGVVGVPNTEAGELPRAYIVKQPESNLSVDDVHKFVNANVSYYKQLRGGVIFLKEIPKLPSGKILRRHLRELAKKDSKL